MGVYNIKSNNDSLLNEETYIECAQEPGIEAAYTMIAESEQNYNNMMKMIGIQELNVFETTGQEMVYEAVDIKGFIAAAKKFFLNIWEKIKGLFKKFFSMFDAAVKNDKEFLKKYNKELTLASSNLKDFEFEGFNFKLDAVSVVQAESNMNGYLSKVFITSDVEKSIENYKDEDLEDKMRGAAIGKGDLTQAELAKELFSLLRSGEDSKETISSISLVKYMNEIEGSANAKKRAEKSFKEIKKAIDDIIKMLEKEERDLLKEKNVNLEFQSKKIKDCNNMIAAEKTKLSILQTVNGAILTAIKDQNKQARSVCVKAMSYKPKNESGLPVNEGTEDFWNSIQIR